MSKVDEFNMQQSNIWQDRRIAELERQLAEAKAEVEAMRPMVKILTEAVSKARPKRNVEWYVTNIRIIDVVYVRDYLERKQP